MSARKTARRTKASKSPKRKPTKLAASKTKTKKKAKLAKPAAARRPAPKPAKAAKPTARPAAKKAKAAPKKAAPKKTAAPKKKAAPPKVVRRDGTGHLDPSYAATLREHSSPPAKDDDHAFLSGSRSGDDLAEELGEEVVEKMTSGEDEGEEVLDQRVPEEEGGPFVETSANTEFGYEADASNPKGSKREPFPTT